MKHWIIMTESVVAVLITWVQRLTPTLSSQERYEAIYLIPRSIGFIIWKLQIIVNTIYLWLGSCEE